MECEFLPDLTAFTALVLGSLIERHLELDNSHSGVPFWGITESNRQRSFPWKSTRLVQLIGVMQQSERPGLYGEFEPPREVQDTMFSTTTMHSHKAIETAALSAASIHYIPSKRSPR
jgi:hypothetical protein